MTLSCRAQAFSVDNLLRTSSNKAPADAVTEAASPLTTTTTFAITYSKELEKLHVNSKKINRDAERKPDLFVEDHLTKDVHVVNAISHKNTKFEYSIYKDKISHEMLSFSGQFKRNFEDEIVPSFRAYTHPHFKKGANIYNEQDNNSCRLPFAVCSTNAEEKKPRETSPASKNYEASPPTGISSSCFCHGELAFCHHPGIISVADINGSDNSIIVELCHADLWASFHRLGTEMIITKSGRRMFPALKLRVTGLNPDKLYVVRLEFLQPDTRKYRYIYHSSRWMVSGSGDTLTTPQTQRTPEGPISGQTICSQIVSFERLKLTNTEPSKSGQVSLVSMQKFQPQVVIQEVSNNNTNDGDHTEQYVIILPQTSFMAVTAYQNQQITTLKIASNPFAKGFRESGKSRIPYESFMTTLPNLLSSNTALDYLPGLVKPSVWSHYFQRDFNLSMDNRCYDRRSDVDSCKSFPVKMMKKEAESSGTNLNLLDNKKATSPVNPELYTALQKPLCLPLLPQQIHQHHYQLYQQQQTQHQQQILIPTLPHNLQHLLHHLPYNSELLQPLRVPMVARSPSEDHPQNMPPHSVMIAAQPSPAYMALESMTGALQNEQPNISVDSSNTPTSRICFDNEVMVNSEASLSCQSLRSSNNDNQLVNPSHFLTLQQSAHSLAEYKYVGTNDRSRSSHDDSSAIHHVVLPPRCMTEPAKMDVSETCHCVECGYHIISSHMG